MDWPYFDLYSYMHLVYCIITCENEVTMGSENSEHQQDILAGELDYQSDIELKPKQKFNPISITVWIVVAVGIGLLSLPQSHGYPGRLVYRMITLLETLSISQERYKDWNPEGTYGTLEALQEAHHDYPATTIDDLSDSFTISCFVRNVDVEPDESFPNGIISSFTIYAHPTGKYHLRTFAITQDQVVRIFDPDEGCDPENPDTWKPVR